MFTYTSSTNGVTTDPFTGLPTSLPRPDFHEKIRTNVGGWGSRTKVRFLPYSDSVVGETAEQRAAYRQMLRDPAVKASLFSKLFSVGALDLAVEAESDKPNDKRAADFMRHCVARAGGVRNLVWTIGTPGLIEGYSVCEKLWTVEKRGEWQGKIIPRRLKDKDPQTYDLEGDDFRNVTGIRGKAYNAGQLFPIDGFVYFTHASIYQNPTGMSDLRAAYRAYWLIDTAWKLRGRHLERFTVPVLKGQYQTPEQKEALEAAFADAQEIPWFTFPEGVLIEAMEISQKNTDDFRNAILDLQKEIFLGITGAFLQALEGSETGARSIGEVHQSTAELLVWYLSECVCEVLNEQWVPDCIGYNFPAGTGLPVISLGGVDDATLVPSTQVDEALQRMQLPLSKKELYQRYGRSAPIDEADALLPPVPTAGPMPFFEPEQPATVAADPAPDQRYLDAAAKTIAERLGLNGVHQG